MGSDALYVDIRLVNDKVKFKAYEDKLTPIFERV